MAKRYQAAVQRRKLSMVCRAADNAVRQRQNLRGKIAGVIDLPQRGHDRRHVRVTPADRLPVAVGEMHVPHQRAGGAQRVGNGSLFDVHVEQVAQQFDIPRTQRAQECGRFALAVEQVRLVTIQRLIKQRLRRDVAACSASVAKASPSQSSACSRVTPSPQRPCIEPMMAGAPSVPAASMISPTKPMARLPNRGVRVGETQLVFDPARARADGGTFQPVRVEQLGRPARRRVPRLRLERFPPRQSPAPPRARSPPRGRPKTRTARRALPGPEKW